MAVNKVDVNGSTVLDLTSDSVTSETLTLGATAHNAAGEQITGTYEAPVKSVNGKTGDVTLDYSDVNAQQKLYDLVLEDPIVENQSIEDDSTFTLSSPITLTEGDLYWADIQFVWAEDNIERYQMLSKAVTNDDSTTTVAWNNTEVVLSTTGITTSGIRGSIIITLAKVTSYELVADNPLVHQEGLNCIASGAAGHVEGFGTSASGWNAHAEGSGTTASGNNSHAEGYKTTASGQRSHAEGNTAKASAMDSHAEGAYTTTSAPYSHAEGYAATASGYYSHAEGYWTTASDSGSHAEGYNTTASGDCSHAEGLGTIASGLEQHVQGKYNVEDSSAYTHIVGNGTDNSSRSNAHTLDWNGNAWFAGDVYVGSTSGTNKDNGSKKLATEEYVNSKTQSMSVTLTSAGWDADAKIQTVSVAGVTAGTNGSLRIAQSATDEQFAAWAAAQPRVTAQADGSITVKLAGTIPEIDIPVEVLIV